MVQLRATDTTTGALAASACTTRGMIQLRATDTTTQGH